MQRSLKRYSRDSLKGRKEGVKEGGMGEERHPAGSQASPRVTGGGGWPMCVCV